MKKLFTLIFAIISLTALQVQVAEAQCPGCTIDPSCGVGLNPVEPALCPAALPNATQGQYYDQNATFFMPRDFTDSGSGQDVTLNSVTVTSVTGIPQGLAYECDQPGCAYTITNDPNTQRGCVKLCGTPTIPGTYNIVIQVVANVSTPIGTLNQPTGFTLPLIVDPAPGGNCCFSYDPPSSCGELDVNYEALLNFEPLQPTEYSWDFGNGDVATGATPPAENYNTPGDYYPELTTTVYNYVLTDISFTPSGSNWCGDVEELSLAGVCQGNPDVYFTFSNGNQASQSSTMNNVDLTNGTSWSNLGLVLENNQVSLQFWDEDNGAPFGSSDDNLGVYSFNVNSTGTFNFSTFVNGEQEGFGSVTIGTEVDTVIVTTDTVSVFPVPAQPTISYTPAQQVCAPDSILLDAPAGPYQYQWLNSGSFVSDSSAVWVNQADQGWYSLLIIDTTYYCGVESDSALVEILAVPQPPILAFNGVSGNIEITNPNGFDVEWYENGILVQGETGDTLPTNGGTGPFSAVFVNSGLCSSSQSIEYWVCIPANAAPLSNDTVCCGETVTFSASGFAVNPFNTVAWAITPELTGPVTTQANATTAGDNGNIHFEYGETVSFTRNCVSLEDSTASETFYVTPFAIEDPDVSPLTYDTLQGCAPYAEICPSLEAADNNWEIFPMVFTFPDGSQMNVNDEIALGLPITQDLLDFATGGTLPCLNLTDLFSGNPNGQWSISVTNTGTTSMDMSVPDFLVINFADSCNLISEDESYLIEGIDVTVNPGETEVAIFNIPPLPGNFPSVSSNCSAFGNPIMITFADCYPNLTNNMTLTGSVTNPSISGGNYLFGYIDVTVTGGNPPISYSWADGPTTEDRFNLGPGTYTVTAQDATGFTLQETFVLTGPPLSINELELYGFVLGSSMPNPTNASSTISFTTINGGDYEFVVYDLAGREISRLTIGADQGENIILFDGNDLVSGVYTYSLSNGIHVMSRRLVINR